MPNLLDLAKTSSDKVSDIAQKGQARLQPLYDAFGVDTWDKLKKAVAKVDTKIGREVAQRNAVTDAQITAILGKLERKTNNRQEWKEYGKEAGKEVVNRVVDKLLDKNVRISNEQGTIEIGAGGSPPTSNDNKIPLGVWIAIALIVLVLIIFLLAKFVFKKT